QQGGGVGIAKHPLPNAPPLHGRGGEEPPMLVAFGWAPYLSGMRCILVVLALLSAAPAFAQTQRKPVTPPKESSAEGPKKLGEFDDWIAATHQESGQTACYAFVRASNSVPAVPGRGDVVLTVTERPSGRDTVAISAGFSFHKDAAVTMQV